MPKSARISGIKSLWCYTIPEAAAVVGVSDRSIRAWITDGLPALNDERPTLLRGEDIITYIKAARDARKTKVAQDAFYCLKCRAAREPAGGMVECTRTESRASLTALCEICETLMHKPVAPDRLPELERVFDLTITCSPPGDQS
ncbi:MAG: helix-turn-helix domain-containing protein [Marinovum sp.]|nr:helix-turn-helix domain-containing protein [Marinovum sp.]